MLLEPEWVSGWFEGTPPAELPTGGESIGGGSSLQPSSVTEEWLMPELCWRVDGMAEREGEREVGLTIQ